MERGGVSAASQAEQWGQRQGRAVNHFRVKQFCVAEAKCEKPGVEEVRLEGWVQSHSRAQNTQRFESQGDWAARKREVPQGSRRGGVEGGVQEARAWPGRSLWSAEP